MGTIRDQEEIDELRRRLYSRGQSDETGSKNQPDRLQPKKKYTVGKTWGDVVSVDKTRPKQSPQPATDVPSVPAPTPIATNKPVSPPRRAPGEPTPPPFNNAADAVSPSSMSKAKSSKKYRWYLLLIGLVVFVLAAGISSFIFWTGSNTISGENIVLELNGPAAVGGGETLSLQLGVTNQNAVPINAAVLIIDYPDGTQSAGEEGGSLTKERIELDTIRPNEAVNVPVKAIVFGEENEDKTVNAAIEYRVEGSNATFYKEATPLEFKISSAPLILDVDSVEKIASGQELTFDIVIRSNTASPISDVLLIAEYPAGFEFLRADPSPTSRQSVWQINEVPSEGEVTVTVTGTLTGATTEAHAFAFDVGTASDRNSLTMASILTTAESQVEIEQPFIALELDVNGTTNSPIILEAGEEIDTTITLTNTLPVAIYDVRVAAALSGNAYAPSGVDDDNGFFRSANHTIEWNTTNDQDLFEIGAGQKETVSFGIRPVTGISSPEVKMVVNVYGKRIEAADAAEVLVGTAEAVVRFGSEPQLLSSAGRNNGVFSDRGPVPPVVDVDTTYTLAFRAEAGNNGVTDSTVTATLPSYVTWLSQTSGDGIISFNPVSREVTWQIGTIDGGTAATAAMQVSITPSLGQVGSAPILMSTPQFRGTDRFTGDTLRASARAVSTELSTETGFEERNGFVVETLEDSIDFNQSD